MRTSYQTMSADQPSSCREQLEQLKNLWYNSSSFEPIKDIINSAEPPDTTKTCRRLRKVRGAIWYGMMYWNANDYEATKYYNDEVEYQFRKPISEDA